MRQKILLFSLLAISVLSSWQWYLSAQKLISLEAQFARMENHAGTLERQVLTLEQALAEAEKKSIDSILDNANKHLIDGWDSLLNEFEDRIDKLRDQLHDELKQEQENNEST